MSFVSFLVAREWIIPMRSRGARCVIYADLYPDMNSRKMQMGIVVGFLLNVLFGVWTYLLSST